MALRVRLTSAVSIVAVIVAANLQLNGLTEAGRVKIHLTPMEVTSDSRFERQAPTSACRDRQATANSGLPAQVRSQLNQRVRFFSSMNAREYIDAHVYTRVVSGVDNTVREVFQMLQDSMCYPFFFGGVVRDMFLGRMPNDVDVEVECNTNDVDRICRQNWGADNCQLSESGTAHIGRMTSNSDEILDFKSTDETFYMSLSKLEYTVNSLAYDLNNGNNIIIDLTGVGVEDVCASLIRIPSDSGSRQSWDEWRMVEGGERKIYRFWKLRTKNLDPINDATLQYIVSNALVLVGQKPNDFGSFYCGAVYTGTTFNDMTNTCTASSAAVCSSNTSKVQSYDRRFMEDFGSSYTTFQSVIPQCGSATPLLASMVMVAVGIMLSIGLA